MNNLALNPAISSVTPERDKEGATKRKRDSIPPPQIFIGALPSIDEGIHAPSVDLQGRGALLYVGKSSINCQEPASQKTNEKRRKIQCSVEEGSALEKTVQAGLSENNEQILNCNGAEIALPVDKAAEKAQRLSLLIIQDIPIIVLQVKKGICSKLPENALSEEEIQKIVQKKIYKLALKACKTLQLNKALYKSSGEGFFKIGSEPLEGKPPACAQLFGDSLWARVTLQGKVGYYVALRYLGGGGFNNCNLALKPLKASYKAYRSCNLTRSQLSNPNEQEKLMIKNLRHEMQLHLALQSQPILKEGIVRVFDYIDLPGATLASFMEYCSGGELLNCLSKISNNNKKQLLVSIFRTLAELHRLGFYHGDLKPSNILLMEQDGQYVAKIIDFGGTAPLNQNKIGGTTKYLPPELYYFGKKAFGDNWAMGLILYQMKFGYLPACACELETRYHHNPEKDFNKRAGYILANFAAGMHRLGLANENPYDVLILKLLHFNYEKRISIKDALEMLENMPEEYFSLFLDHFFITYSSLNNTLELMQKLIDENRIPMGYKIVAFVKEAEGSFFAYTKRNQESKKLETGYVPCEVIGEGSGRKFASENDSLTFDNLNRANAVPLISFPF